ncbi:thiamine-phosphate kinase [Aerolutibacter ruishenii]|uniref:thiamine-phosphate kinase n=1 Tax=Aerolutibacter ruishenii TaxID=686800 RepID=UPI001F553E9E|nr:thiamine-phosphate kinase [Lysobacter ruishenii]
MGSTAEFDLIERIRRRAATRDDVVLGIGDDAAILQPPPGQQLVVAMDTLNTGVHFPEETAPADIGWKALAVNLSDLAAMGAMPAWCTLSLSLPHSDAAWVDAFLDGFLGLAQMHGVALVGGDTTRGPLSVSVTVHGFVAPGLALRRDAARVGDEVWVSGTVGDAAGALAQWTSGQPVASGLRDRLDRPTPRVALGRALVGLVHACIDISDGLAADLAHVAQASGVSIDVHAPALPASEALVKAFDVPRRMHLQATGGDDYELCFTAPGASRAALVRIASEMAIPLTSIGTVTAATAQLRLLDAAGRPWVPSRAGYEHFSG